MLMFNGKPLPMGVKMVGYTLWSPDVQLRTLDIPSQRGVLRTGSKIGSRSLRLELVIESNNTWQTTAIAENLRKWCLSDGAAKLKLPNLSSVYLLAECERYPAPDMAKPWEPFEVTFMCFRPEFISETVYSEDAPGDIMVGGTVSTPVRIVTTLAAEATDPTWTIDDYTIAVSGTVSAGVVVIDTADEAAKITNDGVDITNLITLESDLAIMLEPGTHTVGFPEGLTGTCSWQNRFI